MLFFVLFLSEVFMVLWLVFCVFGKVAEVLNMLVFFSQFGGFCGVAYSCLFGFGSFRCFCGSCVCFSFVQVLLLFVLALFLFCCWIVVGVVLAFLGFLFGGFKGQMTWPKGPPHLALNPPYFWFFCVIWLAFLSLLLNEKPCFPPRKGHCCSFFCVSRWFSLALPF